MSGSLTALNADVGALLRVVNLGVLLLAGLLVHRTALSRPDFLRRIRLSPSSRPGLKL
jgi:hypothetical protein